MKPAPATDPVAKIYDDWAEFQWHRLDAMPCEFHIHRQALLAYLPAASRVLDIGAGPGRYALELARAGHRVVIGDLSPCQLEAARARAAQAGFPLGAPGAGIEEISMLDARDLGRYPDGSFDAVVALGPFYHLQDAADRARAAREAARVLRPGGLLFAAFMPRQFWLSLALHQFILDPRAEERHLARLEGLLDHGLLAGVRSPQLRHSWFCRPEEIAPLFRAVGVHPCALLASAGVVGPWSSLELWERLNSRPAEIRTRFLELVRRTSEDPHVLAMSDQVLFIGKKGAS